MITDPGRNSQAQQGLISALKSQRVIAVTGAGLSVWAGYPTWNELISRLANAVRDRRGDEVNVDLIVQNNRNPLHCLQKLGAEMERRSAFEEFVRTEFRPVLPRDPSVLSTFVSLPFHHILTLNFEESLERAHSALNIQFGSLSSAHPHQLIEFIRTMNDPGHPRQIVHLHGKVSDQQGNMILTEDDYNRLYRGQPLFSRILWSLVASRTLVFFGFGFNDPDFNRTLEDVKRDVSSCGGYHYALVGLPQTETDKAERNRFNNSFLIEPVFYNVGNDASGREHNEFVTSIRSILESVRVLQTPGGTRPDLPQVVPDSFDLQIIDQLGQRFIQKVDPGDLDVPR